MQGHPPRAHPPALPLQSTDSFEFFATEHFRMSGVYWGLTALHLLGALGAMEQEEVVAWLLRCQKPGSGFGGSERNDAHLLYTLSALQILALYDRLDLVDADAVARCKCRRLRRGLTTGQRGAPGQERRKRISMFCCVCSITDVPRFRCYCACVLNRRPCSSPCRCGEPAAARRLVLGRRVG